MLCFLWGLRPGALAWALAFLSAWYSAYFASLYSRLYTGTAILLPFFGGVEVITGYFGLPGSGKSTFLASIAYHFLRRGIRVFVNKDFPIDGCCLYDWDQLGNFDMSNSLILIDEVSLYADNRDFKKFGKQLKQFMILHRHYHCDVIWCTQQFDGVDRKIRELTNALFYIRIAPFGFSYAVRLQKYMHVPTIREVRRQGAAEITSLWVRPSLLSMILTPRKSFKFCWRNRYYKLFDSFDAPVLPVMDWSVFDIEAHRSSEMAQIDDDPKNDSLPS